MIPYSFSAVRGMIDLRDFIGMVRVFGYQSLAVRVRGPQTANSHCRKGLFHFQQIKNSLDRTGRGVLQYEPTEKAG